MGYQCACENRFAELKTRSRVVGRTSQANRAERKTHVRQPVAVGDEPTATATTGSAGRRCRARAPEQSRSRPGFKISVEFRRNFGKFFVFARHREKKFRYFSVFFVSKFKNSKKNVKKYVKNMIKN